MTPSHERPPERAAHAVAEEVVRRQHALVSRVSHELRTPLHAILGFGELLRAELGVGSHGSGHLAHLLAAARHMLSLVDDLLELERIGHDPRPPVVAPVNVRELLASCAHMLAPLAASADVTLEVDDAGLPVLTSDERALRQVLLNLASNAIKYGRRGGRVRLGCVPRDGGDVAFMVSDDGPGLTAAQLSCLFRPFERLGQDASDVRGSGLGLLISREIAESLGGTLVVESVPGEGTTATLGLRRAGRWTSLPADTQAGAHAAVSDSPGDASSRTAALLDTAAGGSAPPR
jgi:signal transduction histidine kinase